MNFCFCTRVFCVALLVFALIPNAAPPEQMFSQARPAMGTTFTIFAYAASQQKTSEFFEIAFDEIERVEEELSDYRPSSELARINRVAADEAVTTDPEVYRFLQTSMSFSRKSDGAFDITVGPLMRAWGFFRGRGHYTTPEELSNARKSTGLDGSTFTSIRKNAQCILKCKGCRSIPAELERVTWLSAL